MTSHAGEVLMHARSTVAPRFYNTALGPGSLALRARANLRRLRRSGRFSLEATERSTCRPFRGDSSIIHRNESSRLTCSRCRANNDSASRTKPRTGFQPPKRTVDVESLATRRASGRSMFTRPIQQRQPSIYRHNLCREAALKRPRDEEDLAKHALFA